ncbi:MAG: DJ-1/PfpI family protein [Alphaproteobacteria bacterium]|nr:DJ-1/PfpI family protein [Alphaproteobacteria bacterium]MCW5738875.1 DJ-1/PfpI family protein [Alphaproteobacteria bacterium]
MPAVAPRTVVFTLFADFQLLDVAGPLESFSLAERLGGTPAYDLRLLSVDGGLVRSSSGAALLTEKLATFARRRIDTLIVPGGHGVLDAADDARLVRWVARHATRARRAGSVCSGTFVVAEAGLLKGRRAATHWSRCDQLARRFPDLTVERDAIFVRDGAIFTSAGVTAGIDLALALIEEDLGRDLAMQVARHLVVFMRRPGGQSQFSAPFAAQLRDSDGSFDELHRWIAGNLERDLSVEALAARAGMSPRHFARVYRERTGQTPAKAVERFRLEAARRALESNEARLDIVARDTGLGGADRLRTLFRRRLGVAPRAYRASFAATAASP